MYNNSNYEIHATFHNQPYPTNFSNVIWHQIDLMNFNAVNNLLEEINPKYLLHLAWFSEPDNFLESTANLAWLSSSLNLLDKFGEFGGIRTVMIGSCFEYDWQYGYCTENLTPLNPTNLYGKTKKSVFELATHIAKQYGMSLAWARLFYVYGPREDSRRALPKIINKFLNGTGYFYNLGYKLRDFMFLDDVAGAIIAILQSFVTGPINVAYGQSVSVLDLVNDISLLTNAESLLQIGPNNRTSFLSANINKLKTYVDYIPQIPIENGLKPTIQWWKEQIGK